MLKDAKMNLYSPETYKNGIDMTLVWSNLKAKEYQFLSDWICNNTLMYYEESELWDIIGIKPYTLEAFFPFKCRAMPWANNRIRV